MSDELRDGSNSNIGSASSEGAERVKLLLQQKLRRKGLWTIQQLAKTDPEGVLSGLTQSESALKYDKLRLLMEQIQLAKAREVEPLGNYIKLAHKHFSRFPNDFSSLRSFFRDDLTVQDEVQAEAIASIFSMLPPTLTALSYRTLWASLWLPRPAAREMASQLREEIAAVRQRYFAPVLQPVLQQDKGFAELIASISLAKNIAIVGSGPSLHGSRLGAKIDAHDLVVRINFSPVGGTLAEDVGSQSDVVFTWAAPTHPRFKALKSRDKNETYQDALVVQSSLAYKAYYTPFSADDLASVGVSRFTRLPPAVLELAGDLSYSNPTGGFIPVIFIALILDRPVSLFGFDFFETHGTHFWNSKRPIVDPLHEPWFEKRMVVNMLKAHFGVV